MNYISVADAAKRWGLSERSVRNYCAAGRVPDAYLAGKTWRVPEAAVKPERSNKRPESTKELLDVLREEKEQGITDGIYGRVQIELTYNSHHIDGGRLTRGQVAHLFETGTVYPSDEPVLLDDVVEAANHFQCLDLIIDHAAHLLSENFIFQLYTILKSGTTDSRRSGFIADGYRRVPMQADGRDVMPPERIPAAMKRMLSEYAAKRERSFTELMGFHFFFESVHPFQDGNGRLGRLILFKECLRNRFVPFIIDDSLKMFYFHSFRKWDAEQSALRNVCLSAQDKFKKELDAYGVYYRK